MAVLGNTILVLMNGPKRAGKDSIIREYCRDSGPYASTFHPLAPGRSYVEQLLGEPLTDENYESQKDKPNPLLAGMTIREALIDFSENVMKPRFGQDIFIQIMLRAMAKRQGSKTFGLQKNVFFVASVGFEDEIRSLRDSGYFHPRNILLVRIERKGHTFLNDSRSYIDTDKFSDIEFLTVRNDGAIRIPTNHLECKLDQMQAVNF